MKKRVIYAPACNCVPHICLLLICFPCAILIADPKIKAHVQNYLDQSNHHYSDGDSRASPKTSQKSRLQQQQQQLQQQQQQQRINTADATACRPSRIPTIIRSPVHMPKNCTQSPHEQRIQKPSQLANNSNGTTNSASSCFGLAEPAKKSGFEAYMMTGDLILNLSRTQQSSGLITSQSKKV